MAAAALLTVTLVPVLVGYCIGGRPRPERKNLLQRWSTALYRPLLGFAFRFKWLVLVLALLLMAVSLLPFSQLGSEFMPALWEGDLLYMPTTLPGISITKAREVLQQTDRILKSFPEVDRVFGKVGRAETSTDPAPLSMIETTIMLKPESQWREGMTPDKLIEAMDAAIQVPGLTNAWTMPIKTRIDMLSTGIKTPVGIKISGPDLRELERLGKEVEQTVRQVPGTLSVYAERVMGGHYLDFQIDRNALAVYGLQVGDVQEVIQSRHRRHEHYHYCRGPGTLPGESALQPRTTAQPAGPERHPGIGAQRPDSSPGPVGGIPLCERSFGDQERERQAQRLGLRGHPERGHRRLRGAGATAGRSGGPGPAGLHHRLEWPVRVHAAGSPATDAWSFRSHWSSSL